MVRPIGVEPTHLAPEASALSTELRAQITKLKFSPPVDQATGHFKLELINRSSSINILYYNLHFYKKIYQPIVENFSLLTPAYIFFITGTGADHNQGLIVNTAINHLNPINIRTQRKEDHPLLRPTRIFMLL
jgi:hypothetical protein